MDKEVAYIALKNWDHIGPSGARTLRNAVDQVEDVFSLSIEELNKILPNRNPSPWDTDREHLLEKAEKTYQHCQKLGIKVLHLDHPDFPVRFKAVSTLPICLFYQGNARLNGRRTIGIVGTRTMTEHGEITCEKLVESLAPYDPLIISGLAYGVDVTAHRAALKNGLDTVAMMGTGPDLIYPNAHRNTAKAMLEQGGLMTELDFGKGPEREHFPMRNQLVAAMSDALIVVESKAKGGSLITADMAHDMKKPLFSFPGRAQDENSRGCNALIKKGKARLIEHGEDVIQALQWQKLTDKTTVQRQLFVDLNPEEQRILDHLRAASDAHIDQLSYQLEMPIHQLSTVLLELEFKGLVKSRPGNRYLAI